MKNSLSHADLKAKQRAIRHTFPQTMSLRVHRAISWIGRAEACDDDDDARFIFLWIAFNAAYADEQEFQSLKTGARKAFRDYFGKVVTCDTDERIHDALWEEFLGPVGTLMKNRYVFDPFWQHQNGIEGFENWKSRFAAESRHFRRALRFGETVHVLRFVFGRLYVLRNQLVHGGSTWDSDVNREQVRDGASILTFLLPVFVDLMMDHPDKDWGRPFYPVVE